ncbi:hypothetical protein LCGC14_2499320, partial [marine sediment metagenome]
MKICGLYKFTSPSKKIYIGQSVDVITRLRQHKHSIKDKRIKTKLRSSFIKYGFDKHEFEVLCQCDRSELDGLEKYYINLYQTFDSKYGLNLKEGGARGKLSKESILKTSNSN